MVSVLSRENQHELCVYARKFGNLLPFGCWWFVNNPSIVEEITTRAAGDCSARASSRSTPTPASSTSSSTSGGTPGGSSRRFSRMRTKRVAENGRPITRDDVVRDVTRLFRTNFEQLTATPSG